MAEAIAGLAVASSIITVIDTTYKVVEIGYKCYKGIKNPPKELQEVMSEVMSLQGVLNTIHRRLSNPHDDDSRDLLALEELNRPDGVLSTCAVVLQDVLRIIEGLQKKKLGSVIAAATSGQKFLETKSRIERLKGLLMLALSSDHITLSHAIEEYLHLAFGELQQGQEKIHCELLSIDNHIAKLSLASDNMASSQKEKHEADRYYNTLRLWLIEGKDFSEWAEKNNSTFWLHAIPGAGKTILCSTVIQQLQSRSQPIANKPEQPSMSTTVYFYFDFRNSEQQHTEGILCSLLGQLANKLTEVPQEVCSLWEMYKDKKTRPLPEELLGILILVIQQYFDKVYIALDALDECSEREVLLPILNQLMDSKCASIFLTSRSEYDIQKSLSGKSIYSAAIESADVALDVELFVNRQIKAIESLRDLNVDLQNEIVQKLVDGAKGMQVPMGCLSIGYSEAPREAKGIPILMGIQSEEEKELIRRTLQFIIFAVRPMTMGEIAEAVAVEDSSTTLDPEDRFQIPEHLVKTVGSLLTTTGGFLGLSHYSVQEYLQSPRISTSPASYFAMTKSNADEEISRKCLTYLAYDDFNVGPCKSDAEFELRLVDYPFLEYAANSWTIMPVIPGRKAYEFMSPPIVYYPALWGLHVLLERLVIDDANVNIQGGYCGQALQAASINQNHQCFKLLLDHGADVHSQGGYFGNALQASAFVGCEDIVKALVERNCRVDAEGGAFGNALLAASSGGHAGTVCMLLEAGAEVNALGGSRGGYALHAAAINGHYLTCEALINKGALVNAQWEPLGSALQVASYYGRTRVVELLLERGAEVNAQGGYFSNALVAACYSGHEQVARLLLIHGADVSSSGDHFYGTPLQAAVMVGFMRVVTLLIQYGADVNQHGGFYGNALQAAARSGHERIVETLLRLGVDVNRVGGSYGSALQAACHGGFIIVVKMLLDQRADPNLQSGIYGNPLQAAACSNKVEIVQLLLDRGANINAVGGKYHTTLHAAAHQGHENIVEMLLTAGADVGIVGGKYGSALDAATYKGHIHVADRLRKAESVKEEVIRELVPTDIICSNPTPAVIALPE
ncbi:hypothetical protein V500_09207 [Pseudogymnoascus sp. VKM F-4518 (FW-2643)]|nr:hypothetical protein V500_09207 [Pseudogymnoascus sp. VKM F-4518 (FW-2643)]